jgi:hypothetical protein
MQHFFKLEAVTRRAPLGLRFLDMVRAVSVNDALVVTAWQLGTSGPKWTAIPSPLSGVYGFRALPGLERFEVGERPASDWCGSPPDASPPDDLTSSGVLRDWLSADENVPKANFIVTVEDRMNRYQPQLLLMCLPKERLIEVPLFSSPARQPPAGLGVVHGELITHPGSQPTKPASWALVTAILDGHSYVAVADARGMFVLFVPYASALPPLVDGQFPHGSSAIDQLTWSITIQVSFQPSKQRFVPGVEPPDILSIMEQGSAHVSAQVGELLPELTTVIRFGKDLVVATEGQSELFIDPTLP